MTPSPIDRAKTPAPPSPSGVRCAACHGTEAVRTQDDLGENGLCDACRDGSKTRAADEELGGES